jgi:hypothetical protein
LAKSGPLFHMTHFCLFLSFREHSFQCCDDICTPVCLLSGMEGKIGDAHYVFLHQYYR